MKSFVLIHGGNHGSWCWGNIVARLADRGFWVRAVDLPGRADTAHLAGSTKLNDWVDAVGAVVKDAPTVPVLVAHSMGGVTANQYAERHADDIKRIIYVCAITPRNGDSGTSTMREAGSGSALLKEGAFVRGPNRTAVITEAVAMEGLYGSCSDADARHAVAQLCPELITPLATPLMLGSEFCRVPKTYIGARDDRAVPLQFQIELARRMDATLEIIDGDHSPFYSAPDALVGALLKHG
jgi:pimeloyl-ACP methyl ester carboxylesterase